MRLLLIRHGDPDYEHDSLTKIGEKEASLLVPRIEREKIDYYYVSPLGRAKKTAQPSLDALGVSAEELDWLREFPVQLDINGSDYLQAAYPDTKKREDGTYAIRHIWDMLPQAWRDTPEYYEQGKLAGLPPARHSDYAPVYDRVCEGLDQLLARHGYVREGGLYRTDQGNRDTLALFCHFGLICVILSHLLGISSHVLQHGLCIAPTGVTEVYTEERRKGIVIFRVTKIGDTSHLYAAGEKPSPAARFCETYESWEERH